MQKSLLKQDSQFSILHPGGGRRERQDSSGSDQASHLELIESWGVWGRGSWKDYTVSPSTPAPKKGMPLWILSLLGSRVFQRVCFAWQMFLSSSCTCLVSKSTVGKHNSRDGEKLCHTELFQHTAPTSKSLDTNTHAHMFPTNSVQQQEEYIPLGCWIVSYICSLITSLCSNLSITEDYCQVRFWFRDGYGLVITVLARHVDLFHFWLWYEREKVRLEEGRPGGQQHFVPLWYTNGGTISQQTKEHTYHPTPHLASAHDTECCDCKEKHCDVSSRSYSANSTTGRAKLQQQPHQQGDTQAHMIRRSLTELSNLWCSLEEILLKRLPVLGNHSL